MRKLLFLCIAVAALTSCNVSKTTSNMVVSKAKEGQKKDAKLYVEDKLHICNYLALTEDQEQQLKELFTKEKAALDEIDTYDDQSFARNIYKYETEFRAILNDEQLKMYKKMRPQFEKYFFYSKFSTNAIKNEVLSI